mmetsp:Transcript_45287/g.142010  ORF Transcript_45287/g.142010 Transcript_45287/m.142010 type:complete len:277 (-) Transcript_45287:386-1216(-)
MQACARECAPEPTHPHARTQGAPSAATAPGPAGHGRDCRRRAAAAVEEAVVRGAVAVDLEVRVQPRHPALAEHRRRVAADQEGLALLQRVVVVQVVVVREAGDRALVDGELAVVLALGLQHARQLEQPVGDAVEARAADDVLELRVVDDDLLLGEHARVVKAGLHGLAREVLDVHGTGDALAPEHLVGARLLREAAVGVDVAEVELAASGEHAVDLAEDARLVGGEVDDAVGDHQVEGLVLEPRLVEVLDVSLHERHVRLVVSELLAVLAGVLPRH